MSGAIIHLNTHGTFVKNPDYTLFSVKPGPTEEYVAETYEVPFDASRVNFGDSVSALIPPKGDIVRRVTVSSVLPELYTPLGPGYVYPSYSDQVDGGVYVLANTLAIQPGDFVGYFNTQFLPQWATNFVGYSNISVAFDTLKSKFVFTSPTYSNIFFKNENSASFWGFDIRNPDFITSGGFPAYNFTSGTLTAPLTVTQAGWIRGFTPPPTTGFSYKESVACKLIKNASLTIGGQTIDRLTSERLLIEDDLGIPYENQAGLTILEGKNDTSTISAPRKYYTRLNFDLDTISMNALQNQDVRVNIEFEKFENLPSNLITSNGFLDGNSYVTSNLTALTGVINPVLALGWKNYIIIGPDNNNFIIYNQDTGTFYNWSPSSYPIIYSEYLYIISININSGSLYYSGVSKYLFKANISDILSSSTTPWSQSTYSFFSLFEPIPFGEGKNYIRFVLSDARYVYLWYYVNYFIIGSTYTNIVSGSLDATKRIWTITYRFFNVSAPLSVSDQTALQTFWATYAKATRVSDNVQILPTSSVISSMTQTGSYVTVVGTLTYPSDVTGNAKIPGLDLHNNIIWVRYDSYSDFNTSTSYSYTVLPSGLPASIKDVFPGIYDNISLPNSSFYFIPTFDGRYIYFPTNGLDIVKFDTQNFTSPSAYTRVNANSLNPVPASLSVLQWFSDGQYLYPASNGNGIFSRYDSTQPINLQSSWSYYTADTLIRTTPFEFSNPCGFDGKYIYYYTVSINTVTSPSALFSRITSWHKYDTTKPFNDVKSWEWIDFRGDGNVIASNGTTPNIKLLAHRTDLPATDPRYYTIYKLYFIVGARYIYIIEGDGRPIPPKMMQDFIRYNPMTMSSGGNFPTSVIVKYEKYTRPPPTKHISLYGQTDLNEFTFRQGRTTDSFPLEFVNPVRELWVVVQNPGVISRLVLRLNNEIIIDDDQVTARYIRAFESHTTMPSSSNVNVYSFSLNPEKLHPSGTLNMSRIAYPVLDVTMTSAPTSDLYLRVYSKSFNVLGYQNGLGGLLFNSAL